MSLEEDRGKRSEHLNQMGLSVNECPPVPQKQPNWDSYGRPPRPCALLVPRRLSCNLTFSQIGRYYYFFFFRTNILIHRRHYWCDRFFANSNTKPEKLRASTCPDTKAMHSAFQSSPLGGYSWQQSANAAQLQTDWQHTTCSIKTSISCLVTQRAASL